MHIYGGKKIIEPSTLPMELPHEYPFYNTKVKRNSCGSTVFFGISDSLGHITNYNVKYVFILCTLQTLWKQSLKQQLSKIHKKCKQCKHDNNVQRHTDIKILIMLMWLWLLIQLDITGIPLGSNSLYGFRRFRGINASIKELIFILSQM